MRTVGHRARQRGFGLIWLVAGLATLVPLTAEAVRMQGDYRVSPRPMPEFPRGAEAAWVNTAPLTPAGLRGKVVLLEFWTTS